MDNNSLLALLEKELKRALDEQTEIIKEKRAILVREEENGKEVIGLQSVIEAQRRKAGIISHSGLLIEPTPKAPDKDGENISKTEFVRQFISRHDGVMPAEIIKGAMAEGIECPLGFPYGILQRLKKKKQVSVRKSKYYASEELET